MITKCKVVVLTSGPTVDRIRVNGKTTECKVKAHTLGQMEESMKVSLSRILKRVKVLFPGLTVASMKVHGSTGRWTASAYLPLKMGKKEQVNGSKENVLLGCEAARFKD